MGLRDALRRLRREARSSVLEIPQRDGPPARFPKSALADAFVSAVRRSTGWDVPDHPLSRAARNSSDPEWRESLYAKGEEVAEPPPDLSE